MENKYIITCNISFPRTNYVKLLKIVKSYGCWAVVGDASFIVVTSQNEIQIRDRIITALKRNDKVFVSQVSSPAAWYGFGDRSTEWLQNNICKNNKSL